MEWCCYAVNSFRLDILSYKIQGCDHDNRWLIWLVLKDIEMKKMKSKYVFIYQGTW